MKYEKEDHIPQHDVVALDPGVRDFLTAYSPSAGIGELPTNGLDKTKLLLLKIDRLHSAIAKIKQMSHKERQEEGRSRKSLSNMKRSAFRLWKKIKNARHHMHYTISNFLLDNFSKILLPSFGTQKMLNKETRPFGKRTARDMLSWGHYEFKQRLLWKAKRRNRSGDVFIVSEEKTTMTCGNCGHLDRNVGGSKIYNCSECHTVIGRDINAARNILIRNMGSCGLALMEDSHICSEMDRND
jgi:putative transposase